MGFFGIAIGSLEPDCPPHTSNRVDEKTNAFHKKRISGNFWNPGQ
jgi:hypothetical protein